MVGPRAAPMVASMAETKVGRLAVSSADQKAVCWAANWAEPTVVWWADWMVGKLAACSVGQRAASKVDYLVANLAA